MDEYPGGGGIALFSAIRTLPAFPRNDVVDSRVTDFLWELFQRLGAEQVGVAHLGNRPLRARTAAQLAARQETQERRDGLNTLFDVIVEQRTMEAQLSKAKADLDAADLHERWAEVYTDRERLQHAVELADQIAALGDGSAGIDEELLQDATMVLGAFDAGSEPQPLAEGKTAADLEAALAALPLPPSGDIEPRREILIARQALDHATTALKAHADAAEAGGNGPPATTLTADQLRSIAAVLELLPPGVDPAHSAELTELIAEQNAASAKHQTAQTDYAAAIQRNEQRRLDHLRAMEDHAVAVAAFEQSRDDSAAAEALARDQEAAARSRARRTLATGVLFVLVGAILAVVVTPLLGIMAVIGLIVAVLGGLGLRSKKPDHSSSAATAGLRSPSPPSLPALEEVILPVPITMNPRIQDLQVLIRSEEAAVGAHRLRVSEAGEQLNEDKLAADPILLREVARALDDADAATQRQQLHAEQSERLEEERNASAQRLRQGLQKIAGSEPPAEDAQGLNLAVEAYVESCRTNAAVAKQAARRGDLLAALEQRRQLELTHAKAVEDRTEQGAAVVNFVSAHLDVEKVTAEVASKRLKDWIAEQQDRRASFGARAELVARLDQLLQGGELADHKERLAERTAALWPELENPPEALADFRERVTARHHAVTARAGELSGQRDQLTQSLGSVAAAAESEASADRALADVETLRDCITAATEQLQLAKDRAHANIAPALEAKMSPWLPRITGGRYLDVVVDPSSLTIRVTESSGAAREAQLLSQGTMEQIFLTLRIALSQVLSDNDESSPLVLDDVTVQSDQERTVAILDMLHALSRDHQVVLFTQEQEVVDWACTHLDGSERDQVVALPSRA